jgi:hypothetical protein
MNMEYKFDTKYGEVTLRNAMIDIDGTNLEEGVELYLDGEYVNDMAGFGITIDEETTVEKAEELYLFLMVD